MPKPVRSDDPRRSAREDVRQDTRVRRDEIREDADKKRAKVRAKVRGAAGLLLVSLSLALLPACNTATPASKSASSKACDNVTTVNNYIGLLPVAGTNALAFQTGAVALGEGGLTINVHDLNGTIAQSADTAGGDRTDLTANPSMAAGITGDKPIEAIQKAVSAYATPQDALGYTLKALVKKYGWGGATNALTTAAAACADGSCTEGSCTDGSCTLPAASK